MRERESNCELVESTKVLAKSEGLDPNEVKCPFIDNCDGKTCFMIEPEKIPVTEERKPIEIFNARLQKTVNLRNGNNSHSSPVI